MFCFAFGIVCVCIIPKSSFCDSIASWRLDIVTARQYKRTHMKKNLIINVYLSKYISLLSWWTWYQSLPSLSRISRPLQSWLLCCLKHHICLFWAWTCKPTLSLFNLNSLYFLVCVVERKTQSRPHFLIGTGGKKCGASGGTRSIELIAMSRFHRAFSLFP